MSHWLCPALLVLLTVGFLLALWFDWIDAEAVEDICPVCCGCSDSVKPLDCPYCDGTGRKRP